MSETDSIQSRLAAAEEQFQSIASENTAPGYLQAANRLGGLYLESGQVDRAIQLLNEVAGAARLPNQPAGAAVETLTLLGSALLAGQRPEAAEQLLREALVRQYDFYSPKDPALDPTQFQLAMACKATRKFSDAEALLRNVVKLRAASAKTDPGRYIAVLRELGLLYVETADYAKAGPPLSAALDLQKQVDETGIEMAEALAAQARLRMERGRFPGAKQGYHEALRIALRRETDARLYPILMGAAEINRRICQYGAAEMFLQRAFEIGMQYAVDQWWPVDALARIAQVRAEDGDLEGAQFYFEKAIGLGTSLFGLNNQTDAVVARQAVLLEARGNYASAEAFRRKLVRFAKDAYGAKHPAYAAELADLGVTLQARGAFAESETVLREAAAILEARIGPDAPYLAPVLGSLGDACAALGKYDEARNAMRRCEAIHDRTIGQAFAVMGESGRRRFSAALRPRFWKALSLVLRHFGGDASAVEFAHTLALKRKAIAVESGIVFSKGLLDNPGDELREYVQRLAKTRAELVRLLVYRGARNQAWTEMLHQMLIDRDFQEEELAKRVPELNIAPALRGANTRAIRVLLPKATALLEYVQFEPFDFEAVAEKGGTSWGPARYLLFAMGAQGKRVPELVDLGEAAEVDARAASYRDAASHGSPLQIDIFDEGDIEDAQEILRRRGERLREMILTPVTKRLAGAGALLIAPDGNLNLVAFGSLPYEKGPLLRRFRISYLSCGRDLIRFRESSQPSGEPLVIAAPAFDADAVPGEEQGMRFEPLEGTRVEGELVHRLIGGRLVMDREATVAAVLGARNPAVLHLATHGFFAGESDPREGSLLQSGLALAYANAPPSGDRESGLLVAEQVRDMVLFGTKLVVLSACDTALGEVQAGEGVFGLRHSFLLAGARALVMSLWRVPDEQTQQLMGLFYGHLIAGLSVAEALRKAQLEIRKEYAHPLFWAAFVAAGDPCAGLAAPPRDRETKARRDRTRASTAGRRAAPSGPKPSRRTSHRRPGT